AATDALRGASCSRGIARATVCDDKEAGVARPKDANDPGGRHFLECMAWVGTGAVWALSGGILKGSPLGQTSHASMMAHGAGGLRFVQISDSPIGFAKPGNTDV